VHLKKLKNKSEFRAALTKLIKSNSRDHKEKLAGRILDGIQHIGRVIRTDQYLYRANKVEELPENVPRISYPPSELVDIPLQRCNYENSPVFYSSTDPCAALYEIAPEVGDLVALSKWKVEDRVSARFVGYSSKELNEYFNGLTLQTGPDSNVALFDFVNRYLNNWFRSHDSQYYHVTSAISEHLLKQNLKPHPDYDEVEPVHDRLAVLYPSIALDKLGPGKLAHNLVFSKKAIDDSLLKPVEVIYGAISHIGEGSVSFGETIKTNCFDGQRIVW